MRRSKVLELAKAAKLMIKEQSTFYTIYGEGSVAVRFFEDGKQCRADVRLDMARNMTVNEAAKALHLI